MICLRFNNVSRRQISGYTLIELMLYVGIVSSLLLTVSGFYAMALATRTKAQVIAEVNQQGAMVIETISHTVRNANAINTPSIGTSAASTSIAAASAPQNPTIFDVNAGAIRIKEGTAAAVPITGASVQVTALMFRNLSRTGTEGALQVSFTLSSTNPSGRNQYEYQKNFSTTVALRQ